MKLKYTLLMVLLTSNVSVFSNTGPTKSLATKPLDQNNLNASNALELKGNKLGSSFLRKITPELLYSYIDFHFDSSNQGSFNRYNGHSNVYTVGADHINLFKDVTAGVYVFNIDTAVSSEFLLNTTGLTATQQYIDNNTLFGHLLKSFDNTFYLDLAGAYGQNKLNVTYHTGDVIDNESAIAHTKTANWFITANAIYRTSIKKFLVRANLGSMFILSSAGNYSFAVPNTNIYHEVLPLTNKTTLIQENVEVAYTVNSTWSPFVNGGLIQVARSTNSRPLIDRSINGILPQIDLNMNGFRVGAGATFSLKKMTLRVEEKYYNASSTFQSYQSIATLEYRFD